MAAEQQREDSSKERQQTSLTAGVWLATVAHWPEGMPFFGAGTSDPPGIAATIDGHWRCLNVAVRARRCSSLTRCVLGTPYSTLIRFDDNDRRRPGARRTPPDSARCRPTARCHCTTRWPNLTGRRDLHLHPARASRLICQPLCGRPCCQ